VQEAHAQRVFRATEMALREKVDSVGYQLGVAEVIAGYVAQLEKSRVGVSELASRQLVLPYEADAAGRVLLVQRASSAELPSRPASDPTLLEAKTPMQGQTLPLELPPPVLCAKQPLPAPVIALPTSRPDVTVPAMGPIPMTSEIMAPSGALPVWKEREVIFADAHVYYSNRAALINLGEEMHRPIDEERVTGAPYLLDSCYPLRCIKTYLQCRCGMPLWAVLATCKLLLYAHSHAMRRAVLNHVIYTFFTEDSFAREFYDMNVRGGGKHYALAPPHLISPEERQVAETLAQEQ
jgi:hypothetical protein